MKALIQRVTEARVDVDGTTVGKIGAGLLVLVCVEPGDVDADLQLLVRKIANLRIFNDSAGVMNLSVRDVAGQILCVSQFTLAASVRKGNRPSYIGAAAPAEAAPMYERFCTELGAAAGTAVERGVFGADMQVHLINSGPVTIWLDSRNLA